MPCPNCGSEKLPVKTSKNNKRYSKCGACGTSCVSTDHGPWLQTVPRRRAPCPICNGGLDVYASHRGFQYIKCSEGHHWRRATGTTELQTVKVYLPPAADDDERRARREARNARQRARYRDKKNGVVLQRRQAPDCSCGGRVHYKHKRSDGGTHKCFTCGLWYKQDEAGTWTTLPAVMEGKPRGPKPGTVRKPRAKPDTTGHVWRNAPAVGIAKREAKPAPKPKPAPRPARTGNLSTASRYDDLMDQRRLRQDDLW